jgi:long-chain acyl-CoA synthetase
VRRKFIAEKYTVLIDALYSGKTSQYIETQVKFEDGRTGVVAADLKIEPCKTYPAVQAAA